MLKQCGWFLSLYPSASIHSSSAQPCTVPSVVRSNQPGVLQQLRARCFPKAGHRQRQSVPQQAERHHKHTQTDIDTHTDTHSRDCVNTRKFSARTPRPGSSLGVYTRGAPSGAPAGSPSPRPLPPRPPGFPRTHLSGATKAAPGPAPRPGRRPPPPCRRHR